MKFTRRQLRKTIRRVLKESVMGHLDGNISNEYLSLDIVKDIFYLQLIKNKNSDMRVAGGIQINF